MGGGGAMRAAAKVANGAFRGFGPPVGAAAARTAACPASVSMVGPTSEDVGGRVLSVSENPMVSSKNCYEFDDWVIPDSPPAPARVVFGGAPSLQEAKEATSDLKEAIDNVFLTPAICFESSQATRADSLSKSCDNSEISVSTPSAPRQAFKLLSQSASIQNVVASLASDPKVWEAVLHNPEVLKFCETHNSNEEESVGDNASSYPPSPGNADDKESQSGFSEFFDNVKAVVVDVKAAVVDMMNNLSGYFQNIFGGYGISSDADGSAKINAEAVGASIFGLVVMVIMVIVLKRG